MKQYTTNRSPANWMNGIRPYYIHWPSIDHGLLQFRLDSIKSVNQTLGLWFWINVDALASLFLIHSHSNSIVRFVYRNFRRSCSVINNILTYVNCSISLQCMLQLFWALNGQDACRSSCTEVHWIDRFTNYWMILCIMCAVCCWEHK